jgi:hypothetical protein
MKLKILFFLTVLLLSVSYIHSQTVNLRFNAYVYSWERFDSLSSSGNNTSTTHLRSYQNLLLEVNKSKWSFNTLLQTEGDITHKVGKGFNYRFYNLYLKGTNLFDFLDVKLGRQYISAGVGRGAVDGAYLKMKFGKDKEFQLSGYGGYLTPLTYEVEKLPKLDDNYSLGGQFQYFGVKDLSLGLSYNNKHRKYNSYWAVRPDSLFNARNVLIDVDAAADQQIGLETSYNGSKNGHNAYARLYYDMNLSKISRAEINYSFSITPALKISGGFLYREPQLSYNTIFWVFNYRNIQELEFGADYMVCPSHNFNVYARIANVMYNNSNSLRFSAGVTSPICGISFTKYTGFAGESDGIYAYFNKDLLKKMLFVSTGINYSKYKFGEDDATKVNTLGGLLGFTYRPVPQLSFDIQGQIVTSKIYKYDTRVLAGFNYWLFKKLN